MILNEKFIYFYLFSAAGYFFFHILSHEQITFITRSEQERDATLLIIKRQLPLSSGLILTLLIIKGLFKIRIIKYKST